MDSDGTISYLVQNRYRGRGDRGNRYWVKANFVRLNHRRCNYCRRELGMFVPNNNNFYDQRHERLHREHELIHRNFNALAG